MSKREERKRRKEKQKRRLYEEAFQLWANIFNLEPSARTCDEAWRLRHLAERAFARMQRRSEAMNRKS